MNALLFTLLLAGTNTGIDQKEAGTPMYIPPFQEGKVETIKSSDANKSLYKFHFAMFYQAYGNIKDVTVKIDNCEKIKVNPDSLGYWGCTLKPGKHDFKFYHDKCAVIEGHTNTKPHTRNYFDVTFTDTTIVVVVCKPVIYLYPTEEVPVTIKLDVKGELGFTYPTYDEQWTVLAYPNGKIQDEGTMFNYLFWDAKMPAHKLKYDPKVGAVVSKSNLTGFLIRNLSDLGFTSWEMQDFLTYWVPKMLENDFNYVNFLVNEDYEQIAGVTVTPKPDHMLRVYMVWHAVKDEKSLNCKPQVFPYVNREGFNYVEWGGSEIPLGIDHAGKVK